MPADPISAADLAAIDDPARRAKAIKAAAAAAAALYDELYLEAVKALVGAHGGNRSKASRELDITPQRVSQLLAGTATGASTGSGGEPACYFATEDDADAALRDWAGDQQELDDRRDPLVRGALAAGLSLRQVRDLTGLPMETIERLAAGDIAVAANVSLTVWEQAVEYFADLTDAAALPQASYAYRSTGRALASAIGMVIDDTGRAPAPHPALQGAQFEALTPEQKANLMFATPLGGDIPDPDPRRALLSWDAWAALQCTTLDRAAGFAEGPLAEAMRHCAAVLRHVRTHATLPEDSP